MSEPNNETISPRVRELFFDDGTSAGEYICTTCHRVYGQRWSCCEPQRCECGAPRVENRTCCAACLLAHRREIEDRSWKAATERSADGYDNPVYVVTENGDEWGNHDGHFHDLEWLLDFIATWRFDHQNAPVPVLHVYATKARKMDLDSSIVESALDNFHEDALSEISDAALRELDCLLASWIEKHSPTTYDPDTKVKIVGWEEDGCTECRRPDVINETA